MNEAILSPDGRAVAFTSPVSGFDQVFVMRQDVLEILDAMKLDRPQPPGERLSVFGKNIHECGTARMGVDPKKSVVNGFGQLYDATNVFVTDGAVFATQGCYEPTLTIMAISARAGDYIVDEYRRGNL